MRLSNKEKATATYQALKARKEAEVLFNLEVAQLATKKRRELVNYDMGKANKIRRRRR